LSTSLHNLAVILTHRATVHQNWRIGLASSIISQLDRVWRQSRLSNTTEFRIYNSCVLSLLLYASETWTVTLLKVDIAKLEAFHETNQRRIFGIIWYEFVTNVEVATLLQLLSINEAISRRTHSLFGHVRRMDQSPRLLLPTKPYIYQSHHDRAQDSLAPGGDNQVVRENGGAGHQGALRPVDVHAYREREKARERGCCQLVNKWIARLWKIYTCHPHTHPKARCT